MSDIRQRLLDIKKILSSDALAKAAHTEFVKNTPVLTGNARRNTNLQGSAINANYNYAGKLDRGFSRKAPRGMTKPTMEFIRSYVKKQLGK